MHVMKFNPLADLVLNPAETGLKNRLVISTAYYAGLSVPTIGVELGFNGEPNFEYESLFWDNLGQLTPDVRAFLESNRCVFLSGLHFGGDFTESQNNLKRLLDAKCESFLKDYLFRFFKCCYEEFIKKFSYRVAVDYLARSIDELYENKNLEWLRRSCDLFTNPQLCLGDYRLLNMATPYYSKEAARIACQSFIDEDFAAYNYDEPWLYRGAFVRFNNVNLVKKILGFVNDPYHGGGRLCQIYDDRCDDFWLRDLAEDVIRYFENDEWVGQAFLYQSGKFYKGCLICNGEPVDNLFESSPNLFESYPWNENCKRILIVDESVSTCWEDVSWAARQLKNQAKQFDLRVLWFRKMDGDYIIENGIEQIPEVDQYIKE